MSIKKSCRKYLFCLCLIIFLLAIPVYVTSGNDIYNKTKIKPAIEIKAYPFKLSQVKLLDSSFKKAMELDAEYLMMLEPDRMLLHILENSGMEPKSDKKYGGWSGNTLTGHYLSACSLMYASTEETKFKERVNYIVSELARVQKVNGNGFIGCVQPKEKIQKNIFQADKIEAGKWNVNDCGNFLYGEHKTFAGLIDAYVYTGNKLALEVAAKYADWFKDGFDNMDDEKFQAMLKTEHGGMIESLGWLYALTDNTDYLELAKRFDHKRDFDPLAKREDQLTGLHVNTTIPKITGAAVLHEFTGSQRYHTISDYFWKQVIDTRFFATGGLDYHEHFLQPGQESGFLDWDSTESCCVYNMLKLTRHLFAWQPKAEYMDYYERALYNHILGSQDTCSPGHFTYFYSLKPGHFKIYSTPFDSMWCCVKTGMENHAKYGDTIYFHDDDTLWINLFIPSELNWKEKDVKIRQETKFPEEDMTILTISIKREQKFAVKIRVPYWAKKGAEVKINGQRETMEAEPQSYMTLSRTWKDGDRIEVRLPMGLHLHHARDDEKKIAIMYGPLVLAGELGREGMPGQDLSPNQKAHSQLIPPPVPMLVFDSEEPSSWIKRIPDGPLKFQTINAGKPKDVKLIPISDLHHQRYTVYWDTMPSDDWRLRPRLSLKPATVSEKDLAAGVSYKYYEGMWDKLPEFGELTPVESGVADDFDLSSKNQNDGFGFVFSGYIKITEAGEYYFAAKSDDGSRLLIDGKRIVENDGIHAMIGKNSSAVPLKPGYYPIELSFFERGGGEGLEVLIHTGQGSWKRIPKEMLYRKK